MRLAAGGLERAADRAQLARLIGREERRERAVDGQPVRRARVVERGLAVDAERQRAAHDLDAAHDPAVGLAEHHEVDDLADPALGEEARHEDGGPRQVQLLGRERLVRRPDREAPALLRVEDRPEQAGSVEALGAEPVDRALVADERNRVEVADDPVVLDRQVAVGVALLLAPALRRTAGH